MTYREHMALMEPEDAFTPRHHIVFHMLDRIWFFGNPRWYSTWESEAKNKVLKLACRDTSQATFEQSVLLRMSELLKPSKKRRAP